MVQFIKPREVYSTERVTSAWKRGTDPEDSGVGACESDHSVNTDSYDTSEMNDLFHPTEKQQKRAALLQDPNLSPALRIALDPLNIHRPKEPSPEERRREFEARAFGIEREFDNYSENNDVDSITNNASKDFWRAESNQIPIEEDPQPQNIAKKDFSQKAEPKHKEIITIQQIFSGLKKKSIK